MNPYLVKARRILRTATRALGDGDAESAANRASFAAFVTVRSPLRAISPDLDEAKTHHGTEQAFNLHLVKSGLMPTSAAKDFAFLIELRSKADYNLDDAPTVDEAKRGIEAADNLLKAAESFLSPNRTPDP